METTETTDETLASLDTPSPEPRRTRRPRKSQDRAPIDRQSLATGIGDDGANEKPKRQTFEQQLTGLYEMAGGGVVALGIMLGGPSHTLVADGLLVSSQAAARAHELNAVANKYPAVKRALKTLMTGSVIGACVLGHGGMAVAIAGNHGITLQSLFGTQPKKPTPAEQTPQPPQPTPEEAAAIEAFLRDRAAQAAQQQAATQAKTNGWGFPLGVAR